VTVHKSWHEWLVLAAGLTAVIAAGLLPQIGESVTWSWYSRALAFVLVFAAVLLVGTYTRMAKRLDLKIGAAEMKLERTASVVVPGLKSPVVVPGHWRGPEVEKVQPALELARGTLQKDSQRTSWQSGLLFAFSGIAFASGFGVMLTGALHALDRLTETKAAILVTAAGVSTQVIAAIFLLVYRSTFPQMATFASKLERVNSAGLAWYVIASMSEDTPSEKAKKNELRGALASQMISGASIAVPAPARPEDGLSEVRDGQTGEAGVPDRIGIVGQRTEAAAE
jgi:hypothetical protein